jgi:tetratricopeptide (TPR) repeat protein
VSRHNIRAPESGLGSLLSFLSMQSNALLECAHVRLRVICVLLLAISCAADTIRLKNGRVIYADHVREKDGRLEYEVGDDTYAIPKAIVESVDAGGLPPPRAANTPHHADEKAALSDIPILAADGTPAAKDLNSRVIHDGRVDAEALSAVEADGNAFTAAIAYDIAGAFEQEHGDAGRAGTFYRHGLSLGPAVPLLQAHYASLLLATQRSGEAVAFAERAVRLSPSSADYQALLGFAYFLADRTRDAIGPWKRSLELRPSDTVRQYLAKAERELAAEEGFGHQESSHFTLRYEGSESLPALRRELLSTLEAQFDDMVREFDVSPRENIPVVLYTSQAFFDVTQAPSWADAVNDGKLRIPLDHLTSVTPGLARVLRHELAHSFINQISRGHAPQWLHEGVAQALEPRTTRASGRQLARLFDAGREVPFNMLEDSFAKLSGDEATIAYSESLAAVEFIRSTYGMSDVRRILQRIGDGASPEAALRATIHSGYAGLEQDVGAYLKKTYGE